MRQAGAGSGHDRCTVGRWVGGCDQERGRSCPPWPAASQAWPAAAARSAARGRTRNRRRPHRRPRDAPCAGNRRRARGWLPRRPRCWDARSLALAEAPCERLAVAALRWPRAEAARRAWREERIASAEQQMPLPGQRRQRPCRAMRHRKLCAHMKYLPYRWDVALELRSGTSGQGWSGSPTGEAAASTVAHPVHDLRAALPAIHSTAADILAREGPIAGWRPGPLAGATRSGQALGGVGRRAP